MYPHKDSHFVTFLSLCSFVSSLVLLILRGLWCISFILAMIVFSEISLLPSWFQAKSRILTCAGPAMGVPLTFGLIKTRCCSASLPSVVTANSDFTWKQFSLFCLHISGHLPVPLEWFHLDPRGCRWCCRRAHYQHISRCWDLKFVRGVKLG